MKIKSKHYPQNAKLVSMKLLQKKLQKISQSPIDAIINSMRECYASSPSTHYCVHRRRFVFDFGYEFTEDDLTLQIEGKLFRLESMDILLFPQDEIDDEGKYLIVEIELEKKNMVNDHLFLKKTFTYLVKVYYEVN